MTVDNEKQIRAVGEIKDIRCCSRDIFEIVIAQSSISRNAQPGQFVMVKTAVDKSDDPLLRRPLSIHQVQHGVISLLFKVVGRGTKLLASFKQGDYVDILGPLGKGFAVEQQTTHFLIGGGMGIAPLLFLAETIRLERPAEKIVILLGARSREELVAVDGFFAINGVEVKIATDDGSTGHHGLVTELLPGDAVGAVYCCGPWPMMKAVAGLCRKQEMECQVSIETMMACGMGACLGCAVQGVDFIENGYLHVCKDGPVFEARKIWL